jgi:hypothetical protein
MLGWFEYLYSLSVEVFLFILPEIPSGEYTFYAALMVYFITLFMKRDERCRHVKSTPQLSVPN